MGLIFKQQNNKDNAFAQLVEARASDVTAVLTCRSIRLGALVARARHCHYLMECRSSRYLYPTNTS